MEFISGIIQYTFLQHALWASLFSSVLCGIIGTYIVTKRMVFISGGITHASFGGIGMAFFLGIAPFTGAMIFSLIAAFLIEWFSKKGNIRNDSGIGILWSLGMALGIIFIYITPGFSPNLMSYLFGSILTVSLTELIIIILLTVGVTVAFTIFYRPILYISFDESFSKSQNAPVTLINYSLMAIVALSIVVNIKIAGIILVMSMLTIPQNTALLFSDNFKTIMIYSSLICLAGTIAGLFAAFYFGIPSGATIIFTLTLIFIFAKVYKFISGKNNRK